MSVFPATCTYSMLNHVTVAAVQEQDSVAVGNFGDIYGIGVVVVFAVLRQNAFIDTTCIVAFGQNENAIS